MVEPVQVTKEQIESGEWVNIVEASWRKNELVLTQVKPEHIEDPLLTSALKNVIINNGTYESGDHAVIHSRKDALPLALEMGYQLGEMGIETKIFYSYMQTPIEFLRFLKAFSEKDIATLDPSDLDAIKNQYIKIVNFAGNKDIRGHWIVPRTTLKYKPTKEEKEALELFKRVSGSGLSGIGEKKEKDEIKSHDVIGYPLDKDARALGITLNEWREIVYMAMEVPPDDIKREIENLEFLDILKESSIKNRPIRITGYDGTDITLNIGGRPLIMDIGRVGNNAIEGTGEHHSKLTNYYAGELFCAPQEDSYNGILRTKIPLIEEEGVVKNYWIEFRDGEIVYAYAEEGRDVLSELTGLKQKPHKALEKVAFGLRRIGAEAGFGRVNPIIKQRLAGVKSSTGCPLFDEKNYDFHVASGNNEPYRGKVPDSFGGHNVLHTDYILGDIKSIDFV